MYQLTVNLNDVRLRVDAITSLPNPTSPAGRRMSVLVHQIGALVQSQAKYNVSGYPVNYDGRVFRVQPRTGTLQGAIDLEWPYTTPYKARVYVNGTHTALPDNYPAGQRQRVPVPVSQYAAAVEFGHKEIDLKRTMRGKIVPFFAARSQAATGPYAAVGLTPLASGPGSMSVGSKWRSLELDNKLMAKGKRPMVFTQKGRQPSRGGTGTYYISFRRVGDTGWIIPRAEPRPFMGATMTQLGDKVRQMTRAAVREVIHGTSQ